MYKYTCMLVQVFSVQVHLYVSSGVQCTSTYLYVSSGVQCTSTPLCLFRVQCTSTPVCLFRCSVYKYTCMFVQGSVYKYIPECLFRCSAYNCTCMFVQGFNVQVHLYVCLGVQCTSTRVWKGTGCTARLKCTATELPGISQRLLFVQVRYYKPRYFKWPPPPPPAEIWLNYPHPLLKQG